MFAVCFWGYDVGLKLCRFVETSLISRYAEKCETEDVRRVNDAMRGGFCGPCIL